MRKNDCVDCVVRETEDTVIKVPDLMRLKIELGGGFTTDAKYYFCSYYVLDRTEKLDFYSRWFTETWPLGVDYAMRGRALKAGDILKEQLM